MTRRTLQALDLWGRTEKRLLKLFMGGLQLVREKITPDMDENQINRNLYFCLREANRKLNEADRFDTLPFYEARNQPDSLDECATPREYKRPDFQLEMIDHQYPDPRAASSFFAIECKILGAPTPSWKYNENYVAYGIKRYLDPEHGYGMSARSGVMIGYVRDMSRAQTLAEVNGACVAQKIAELTHASTHGPSKEIHRLEQVLKRPPGSSGFALRHLWLALRKVVGPS